MLIYQVLMKFLVEQHQRLKNVPNWQLLQSEAAAVVPRTFGETGISFHINYTLPKFKSANVIF